MGLIAIFQKSLNLEMNNLTLQFNHPEFERLYQLENHPHVVQTMNRNSIILLVAISIAILSNGLSGNYIFMGQLFLLISPLGPIYYFGRRSSACLDYLVFFMQLVIIFNLPVAIFLKIPATAENTPKGFYFLGQSVSYLTHAFFIGSRFYLKAAIIVINLIGQIIFVSIWSPNVISVSRFLFCLYGYMTIQQIYFGEKAKRSSFMMRKIQSQWEEGMDIAMQLPVMQCFLDKKLERVHLHRANKISQQHHQINVKDQDGFRQFLRSYTVNEHTKYETQQTSVISNQKRLRRSTKQLTLETFIYILLSNPGNIQRMMKIPMLQNMFDTHISIECQNGSCLQKVTLFASYEEQITVNLFFDKKQSSETLLQLRQNNMKFKKILADFPQKLIMWMGESIILLKNVKQGQTQKQRKLYLNLLTQRLYNCYNSLVNLKLYHNPSRIRSLNKFSLKKLIDKVFQIYAVQLQMKKLRLSVKLDFQPSDITLYQNERFLTQVLINLVKNAITYSYPSSSIQLRVSRGYEDYVNLPTLKFTLKDSGESISQKQLDSYLSVTCHRWSMSQKVILANKTCLGLIVSSYLVGEMGPTNEITINQTLNEKLVSFQIYEDRRLPIEKRVPAEMGQPKLVLKDS